jgi:riboflavin kinase/FMN adenylyltransferase
MTTHPELILDAWNERRPPRDAVVAIGNFDGIHRGQRATLERVGVAARKLGVSAGVVTFEPHPLTVLDPEAAPPRLTTERQKYELLGGAGVERVYVIRFDPDFARVDAGEFVRTFLVERLAVREVYVGSRFTFGHSRRGNLALLQDLGARLGFRAAGVREVEEGGGPISSTRIRRELRHGRVGEARALLGRPHLVSGRVARGQGRGRGLGWPTINLESCEQMLPGSGVYTTTVRLSGEPTERPGVTNVGRRPTFDPLRHPVVETHILDFERQAYGEGAEVRFLDRLRDEMRFADAGALADQISLDVAAAREYFRDDRC